MYEEQCTQFHITSLPVKQLNNRKYMSCFYGDFVSWMGNTSGQTRKKKTCRRMKQCKQKIVFLMTHLLNEGSKTGE